MSQWPPAKSQLAAFPEAIAEFDGLGRVQLLAKYEFGEATEFFLPHDDKLYDSKAKTGVAHGFATGDFWTKKLGHVTYEIWNVWGRGLDPAQRNNPLRPEVSAARRARIAWRAYR